MKYIVMVKVYFIEHGIRDYTYEVFSGIKHDSIDDAYNKANNELLTEWYIAEK